MSSQNFRSLGEEKLPERSRGNSSDFSVGRGGSRTEAMPATFSGQHPPAKLKAAAEM